MRLPSFAESVPLVEAEEGRVIRVAGTRVPLDTVVVAFQRGATPEEIAEQYSALTLADVYAVIAYYLRHRTEVEAYLRQREREHAELKREIQSRPEYREFRDRLLARVRAARREGVESPTGRE